MGIGASCTRLFREWGRPVGANRLADAHISDRASDSELVTPGDITDALFRQRVVERTLQPPRCRQERAQKLAEIRWHREPAPTKAKYSTGGFIDGRRQNSTGRCLDGVDCDCARAEASDLLLDCSHCDRGRTGLVHSL